MAEEVQTFYCDVLTTIRNHLVRTCNNFLEGINNEFKLIKRQAYGLVNFDIFRVRLLARFSH